MCSKVYVNIPANVQPLRNEFHEVINNEIKRMETLKQKLDST
jgi:hypothetical protein